MITLLSLERRVIAIAVSAWCYSIVTAWAQAPTQPPVTPSSLAHVGTRVPMGGVIHVTEINGASTRGTLAAVTADGIQLEVKGAVRSVAAGDIQRIQWQQPDSPLTGVLIGAAIGAAPGIYWLFADPNECTGMCPEEYAFIGIGAAIGGVIDHLIHKKVTVYGRPALLRNRKGVQIVVEF